MNPHKHLNFLLVFGASLLITTFAVTTNTLITPSANAQKAQPQLAPEELIKKSDCLQCHSVDKAVVGPAYKDIAARYKDKPEARAALIETVKKGGKGNWSEVSKGVPMPPHQGRLAATDINRLVDWILSFNHQ